MRTLPLTTVILLSVAAPLHAVDPIELPLWPGTAPGSQRSQLEETYQDRPVTDGTDVARDRHVRGVTSPTITVYLPDEGKSTGAAVVVLPGGGFNILAIDKEGHDVARWLAGEGIAGIVVKYRLPDPEVDLFVSNGSLVDAQRSIRLVRTRAAEWGIDPARIGVVGFSAGGYLTAAVGTMFDSGDRDADDPVARASCRPDFIAPVYPLCSLSLASTTRAGLLERMLGPEPTAKMARDYSPDERVTSKTPPTFLVHAHDDGLSSEHSVRFYLALKRAEVPVEMHVYSEGGHGYGIRDRGLPISNWHLRWLEWMQHHGFLGDEGS